MHLEINRVIPRHLSENKRRWKLAKFNVTNFRMAHHKFKKIVRYILNMCVLEVIRMNSERLNEIPKTLRLEVAN